MMLIMVGHGVGARQASNFDDGGGDDGVDNHDDYDDIDDYDDVDEDVDEDD